MPSNYSLLVMYMRFGLAQSLCMTAFYIASAAMLLLPKTHPSRIYLKGRIKEGRARVQTALTKGAAETPCVEGDRAAS